MNERAEKDKWIFMIGLTEDLERVQTRGCDDLSFVDLFMHSHSSWHSETGECQEQMASKFLLV